MPFDWKKKLEDGKAAATTAFGKAATKAEELTEEAKTAATGLVAKIEEKFKKDGPKNG